MDERRNIVDTLYAVASIAATGVTIILVIKIVGGPDVMNRIAMKSSKTLESFAMSNAQGWATLADVASRVYDSRRAVTL